MKREQVNLICIQKADELLQKYFGNLVKEASVDKPEDIGSYDLELPLRIEAEYKECLRDLWHEIAPNDQRNFDALFDKPEIRDALTADDREGIAHAYRDAQRRTLWERIANTNHRDVTYYKGLLEEYTRELLFCMRHDFIEEITNDLP